MPGNVVSRTGVAHSGKDGHPYPVDRTLYDRSLEILATALRQAKLGNTEKLEALKRLRQAGFYEG